MLWLNVIEVNIRLLCLNVIPLKNLLNGLNYCIEMLGIVIKSRHSNFGRSL